MPHCIIECSADLARHPEIATLAKAIHDAAEQSGLFQTADIKTRLLPAAQALVGGAEADFIHINCLVLAGRSAEQKGKLADSLMRAACVQFPGLAAVSCEVRDMERAAYAKRGG
ncbi:5-carboxymethyl-2-hydroxymuconate Delta-isomerase [Chromobacterium alticapitis]|uniref:5-carboxymethyl-2-hydroxymuconate isomerase n=1 Tax=Chromobacterium alticapitis TaxID=2073169 RepID=A0A2S5DG61_9NEIS|nr:5-carboxymethyl-2-hydroxymuconate Delta-isomerase [Chromobacterium alticapitis]POZ62075.1 5-carboxymethyl-2-hydroxymuconate isomerase [Chromobacterium alticapitis]